MYCLYSRRSNRRYTGSFEARKGRGRRDWSVLRGSIRSSPTSSSDRRKRVRTCISTGHADEILRRVIVPAYDDQLLWEGHSSMIVEIRDQLKKKPDTIFCSVGGGGLLGGIIVGCKGIGWDDGKQD